MKTIQHSRAQKTTSQNQVGGGLLAVITYQRHRADNQRQDSSNDFEERVEFCIPHPGDSAKGNPYSKQAKRKSSVSEAPSSGRIG